MQNDNRELYLHIKRGYTGTGKHPLRIIIVEVYEQKNIRNGYRLKK